GEFLRAMQALCHEYDALFQPELLVAPGAAGQLGLEPDIVAFAKKVQVGGIMAGGRVDEVPDNVFHVGSRLGSTWGGGLTDMVRARRLMEIIERDGIVAQVADLGEALLKDLT